MPLVVQTRHLEESNDALAALAIPVWLKASHVVSYALLVVVNAGASLGWVGETNADVSKKWPVPITPAGYAFSIWYTCITSNHSSLTDKTTVTNNQLNNTKYKKRGLIFFLQGVGAIYTFLNVGYNRESHEKEHAVKAACWVQADLGSRKISGKLHSPRKASTYPSSSSRPRVPLECTQSCGCTRRATQSARSAHSRPRASASQLLSTRRGCLLRRACSSLSRSRAMV